MDERDLKFMQLAYEQAESAYRQDEIPVGAVLVKDNRILAANHNRNKSNRDPIAHAEMLVIMEGSKKLNTYRFTDVELFVTIEPCPMCAGAIIYSRIKRLVFGTCDPKSGAVGSVIDILRNSKFNHNPEITQGCGLIEKKCGAILKKFFQNKRKP